VQLEANGVGPEVELRLPLSVARHNRLKDLPPAVGGMHVAATTIRMHGAGKVGQAENVIQFAVASNPASDMIRLP